MFLLLMMASSNDLLVSLEVPCLLVSESAYYVFIDLLLCILPACSLPWVRMMVGTEVGGVGGQLAGSLSTLPTYVFVF